MWDSEGVSKCRKMSMKEISRHFANRRSPLQATCAGHTGAWWGKDATLQGFALSNSSPKYGLHTRTLAWQEGDAQGKEKGGSPKMGLDQGRES